jgi:hypothetical protein
MSTYKERLLKLAGLLDTVPKDRFNLSRWVGDGWKGHADLSCGAPACSLGWATTVPEFQALGMNLGTLTRPDGSKWFTVGLIGESHDTLSAPKAAAHVFGVNQEEFDFLFIPQDENDDNEEYNEFGLDMYGAESLQRDCTPKEAAEHIRHFAEQRWP